MHVPKLGLLGALPEFLCTAIRHIDSPQLEKLASLLDPVMPHDLIHGIALDILEGSTRLEPRSA